MTYVAGVDFGTSGARIMVLDGNQALIHQGRIRFGAVASMDLPRQWQETLQALIRDVPTVVRRAIGAIAINGTSGTVLLCDRAGHPLTAPLPYNDNRGQSILPQLRELAPDHSPVLSATSSLAKLLWWQANLPTAIWQQARYCLHQADWLAAQLHGQWGLSDYHNALKIGYDGGELTYPDWLQALPAAPLLPQVLVPGTIVGPVSASAVQRYGLNPNCRVHAGTTDSIAAFIASGATQPGEAVTSLGSTLVLKLLSKTRVEERSLGIYSHRFGDLWLVGGASNTGGAVLNGFFTEAESVRLSPNIDPAVPSGLDYYPLLTPGERFPINDPTYPPRLEPRPEHPQDFLYGMLEGMARIEAAGYQQLQALGASGLTRVITAGGGAQNPTWMAIRQRCLPVPVSRAEQGEAAFGTARLAQMGGE
ncbi:MAG: FGGY-family carbohydrate kinase [Cyanobacteria bacterium]|nr:FGGY-family carbohydrate kinase [Cyanobacteriota bacterium]